MNQKYPNNTTQNNKNKAKNLISLSNNPVTNNNNKNTNNNGKIHKNINNNNMVMPATISTQPYDGISVKNNKSIKKIED